MKKIKIKNKKHRYINTDKNYIIQEGLKKPKELILNKKIKRIRVKIVNKIYKNSN